MLRAPSRLTLTVAAHCQRSPKWLVSNIISFLAEELTVESLASSHFVAAAAALTDDESTTAEIRQRIALTTHSKANQFLC